MSTTAGYFDETILTDIRVKADEIMFDDRIKQQFVPDVDIFKAISAVQTATVYPSKARNKIVGVDVMWQNVCGQSAETNVTCEIGGAKSSTNIKDYDLSFERMVKFTEDEADFIDNEFDIETAIAKDLLNADKTMAEAFAVYCVGRINTFKGVNTLGTNGKGVVDGTDTYILPAYWDATLAAYLKRVEKSNKITAPAYASGQNLFEQMFVAEAKRSNADGKGDAILYNGMRFYFDLVNIDAVNSTDLVTYMLSSGSLALASRNLNPDVPEVVNGVFTRYTMNSKFIPNMKYDVFYDNDCTTNDLIQHNFKIKLVADLFNNPTGCDDHNTGVLSFICGAPA
jgi:hypothetical protein